ncbi:unnamed protein product [Meloidogyne enterolobii]|uniref:Uncharacterized protein n=1 Tax=Meloidogyne enterolobii TaxID=390850 RepID=A0ACB1ART8_MELEN
MGSVFMSNSCSIICKYNSSNWSTNDRSSIQRFSGPLLECTVGNFRIEWRRVLFISLEFP